MNLDFFLHYFALQAIANDDLQIRFTCRPLCYPSGAPLLIHWVSSSIW